MALTSTAGENASLNGLDGTAGSTNRIGWASLHTASPGTTGANEMASTARVAVTFAAASGGSKANSTAVTWSTPGTNAATHFGLWDASTAGNYTTGAALATPATATSITAAIGALVVTSS